MLFVFVMQLTAVFSETVVKPAVREGDPRCKHEGSILFCDYRNTTEVVEMSYYIGTPIEKVVILNARNVLLSFPVCVDIKFQNVSRVYVTDIEGKPCKTSPNLSVFLTKLDRVPGHISKIYVEDSVIDVLKTHLSLQKLILLNSKIGTLDISKPLFEGTIAVIQGSLVSSFHGIIISKNSSMTFHKTTINKILDRDIIVHSGARMKLDNSSIHNISKGGVCVAPEAQVVIENFRGRIKIKGLSSTDTRNHSNGRADLVSETSNSIYECSAVHAYRYGLIVLAILFFIQFLCNSFCIWLIVKKNSIIKVAKGKGLKNMQEQENLLKNKCVDGLVTQTVEGDMISNDQMTTDSDQEFDNDKIEDSENLSKIEKTHEESEGKTPLALEKINKILNQIKEAENYIMKERQLSTNFEYPCEYFHKEFDRNYDKMMATLERQEDACKIILQGQACEVSTHRLKRISEMKTMIDKAKESTRSYMEKRSKLMAIRRESSHDEKTNKYETMSDDALNLLQEGASSLAMIGLDSKVDVFVMYIHSKYEHLIETFKHNYDKHRQNNIKTYSDSELHPLLVKCKGLYDESFPNGEFEIKMNSRIQNLPDFRDISDGLIERNIDLVLSSINKNTDIIQPILNHENELLLDKKKYLTKIEYNLSTVLTFLRSTLSIFKILNINEAGVELIG